MAGVCTAPHWAYTFPDDADLPYGSEGHEWWQLGYWWVELGGQGHSIHDTDSVRDELLKIAVGVWDHIKNRGDHGVESWALDWLQFLPGKRESRRYIGDQLVSGLRVTLVSTWGAPSTWLHALMFGIEKESNDTDHR